MQKKTIMSLVLAGMCAVLLLNGCGNTDKNTDANESTAVPSQGQMDNEGEHETLTMTAMVPFRNPSHLAELVHEQYPEINIEFVPYSGFNGSAYTNEELVTGDMPDIFIGSVYKPGDKDVQDRLIDLSAYAFTDNYTDQRLREVTEDGSVYMLPLYYNCMGITYNKTMLDKNGWELPNSLEELEKLAPKVQEAGYDLALSLIQFPGSGFQYLFDILSTGYVNTLDGRKWQEDFLAGTSNFEDNAELMSDMDLLQRWHDIGMLIYNGDPESDTNTVMKMAEGNTLFLIGSANSLSQVESDDEFAFMPFLSEDGSNNVYIANITKYIGLNKELENEGNEQKLEDALHVMEIISTVEGMYSLSAAEQSDVLIPLKDFEIPEDNVYKSMESALNEGYVAPMVYDGWEYVSASIGEKMLSFMRGECTAADVAKEIDEEQHLLQDNSEQIYTTVTEKIEVEDCAKLVGICFAKASNADVALVSTNEWFDMEGDTAMNTKGVQCPLYAMPITDQEITAMLPTGWSGTIQTITLTGERIQELAETGFDKFGDGQHLFPYVLVTPEKFALEKDKTYTVAICGVSEEVQEEGNIQDTGIIGLTVVQEYLSQFDTFSASDIVWE